MPLQMGSYTHACTAKLEYKKTACMLKLSLA